MSRYGIDYYGLALYGADTYVDFSSSLTATPYSYGSIVLKWTSPAGNWSKLRLVRNPYGYPTTPFDGITLLDSAYIDDPNEIIDSYDLVEGAYYYYSLFVYEINQYTWVKTGQVEGLSVKRFGNDSRLWDYTPDVYKLPTVSTYVPIKNEAGEDIQNDQLRRFLNLFGFWFDQAQTTVDLLINRYDVQKVNAQLLPLMLKQFGLSYEEEIGAQQARVLLRDATQLQKEKGSLQGLKEYIKSFTGYSLSSPISGSSLPAVEGLVMGHNLMLDYNDSSFEESEGHWVASSETGIGRLGREKITSLSISSNVITFVIGPHKFKVGDLVSVYDFPLPSFPMNVVPVASVTATSLSINLSSYGSSLSDMPSKKVGSGYVLPSPAPLYQQITTTFENKQDGILSLVKTTSGSGDISTKCGSDAPIDKGIPVVGNQAYTFSFYSGAATTSREVTAKINWYDRFGTLLSTSSGTAVADAVNPVVFQMGTRPFVTDTSPASAYYAVPEIKIANVSGSSADIHYVDACQFEKGSVVTEFDEARNLHITLKATRINELVNPNFHGTYAPWSFTNCTSVTDPSVPEPLSDSWDVVEAELSSNLVTLTLGKIHHFKISESVYVSGIGSPYDGVHTVISKTAKTVSFSVTHADIANTIVAGSIFHSGSAVKLTSTSGALSTKSFTTSADYCPIYYPGSSYTASIYFQTGDATTTSRVSITWYDSSKSAISTTDGDYTTANNAWNRASVTSTAPSSAAYASIEVLINTSTGDSAYIFGGLLERSAFVLPYFDGDAEAETVSAEDVFWEGGVVGAGRSHYYKNRVPAIYRLKETLPNFLTAGSTFALYLAQPGT